MKKVEKKAEPIKARKKITYEFVLDYLKQRGYNVGVDGTKKYGYFLYLCYKKNLKASASNIIEFGEISEEVAKKFDCSPGSIEQITRYFVKTRYPNKTRTEVVTYFIEEFIKFSEAEDESVLEGLKSEYLTGDRYIVETVQYLSNSGFNLAGGIDIFVDRPKTATGNPSALYEIGVIDNKGNRVVLRTSSALAQGEGARNQRLADLFYCFDIIKYINKKMMNGINDIHVKLATNEREFFQGKSILLLTID